MGEGVGCFENHLRALLDASFFVTIFDPPPPLGRLFVFGRGGPDPAIRGMDGAGRAAAIADACGDRIWSRRPGFILCDASNLGGASRPLSFVHDAAARHEELPEESQGASIVRQLSPACRLRGAREGSFPLSVLRRADVA